MFSARARYSSGVNDCLTAIKTFTIPKLENRQMFVVIICDSWLSVIICDWCLSVVIIWDSWLLSLFVIGVCGHYLRFMIAVIIVNDVCGHYLQFMIVVIVYGWCLWSLFVIHYCCHYLWLMFAVIICDSWLLLFVTDVCGHCLWLMIVAIICDWCLWSLFVTHDCCHYLWLMFVVIICDSWPSVVIICDSWLLSVFCSLWLLPCPQVERRQKCQVCMQVRTTIWLALLLVLWSEVRCCQGPRRSTWIMLSLAWAPVVSIATATVLFVNWSISRSFSMTCHHLSRQETL